MKKARLMSCQFGGTKITVAEEEFSIFRDSEYVFLRAQNQAIANWFQASGKDSRIAYTFGNILY
jgi:hypothetical protein